MASVKRKVSPGEFRKIKEIHTITNNVEPRGNINYIREESENGGEQEAAIPLTGGFVRSVMVRVEILFTDFCRRGRHIFASWGNSQEYDKKADRFEYSFSLDRRTVIQRKVRRAEAKNVLLRAQCRWRWARKSQQALLTRSFHCERASPNREETSSASQSRSQYFTLICWFTLVRSLNIAPKWTQHQIVSSFFF